MIFLGDIKGTKIMAIVVFFQILYIKLKVANLIGLLNLLVTDYYYLDLKHFIVVTMNYIIEIITEWEPSIEVNKKL